MAETLKLAVPDLVSNSYFPAIAGVQLGLFGEQGLKIDLEMIFPAPACYEALRDGAVQLVAGSAHLPLVAFPRWQGVRLLCSLSQGMYWFLVMRKSLGIERGDLAALQGRRIVAAPGVDLGFKRLLVAAGIDAAAAGIEIVPLPGGVPRGVSFGVAAARAMVAGEVDGFWANGMAAEVAVDSGAGAVVLDVRRGDGPATAFGFTQPTLAAREDLIESQPDVVRAAVRAIMRTQQVLKADPSLARQVGRALFPDQEARLIQRLVERDLDFYRPPLDQAFIGSMQGFATSIGLLDRPAAYDDVVDAGCRTLWAG